MAEINASEFDVLKYKQNVDLSNRRFTDKDLLNLAAVLAESPELETLNLTNIRFHPPSKLIGFLEQIINLPNLKKIYLENCFIEIGLIMLKKPSNLDSSKIAASLATLYDKHSDKLIFDKDTIKIIKKINRNPGNEIPHTKDNSSIKKDDAYSRYAELVAEEQSDEELESSLKSKATVISATGPVSAASTEDQRQFNIPSPTEIASDPSSKRSTPMSFESDSEADEVKPLTDEDAQLAAEAEAQREFEEWLQNREKKNSPELSKPSQSLRESTLPVVEESSHEENLNGTAPFVVQWANPEDKDNSISPRSKTIPHVAPTDDDINVFDVYAKLVAEEDEEENLEHKSEIIVAPASNVGDYDENYDDEEFYPEEDNPSLPEDKASDDSSQLLKTQDFTQNRIYPDDDMNVFEEEKELKQSLPASPIGTPRKHIVEAQRKPKASLENENPRPSVDDEKDTARQHDDMADALQASKNVNQIREVERNNATDATKLKHTSQKKPVPQQKPIDKDTQKNIIAEIKNIVEACKIYMHYLEKEIIQNEFNKRRKQTQITESKLPTSVIVDVLLGKKANEWNQKVFNKDDVRWKNAAGHYHAAENIKKAAELLSQKIKITKDHSVAAATIESFVEEYRKIKKNLPALQNSSPKKDRIALKNFHNSIDDTKSMNNVHKFGYISKQIATRKSNRPSHPAHNLALSLFGKPKPKESSHPRHHAAAHKRNAR